MAALRSPEVLTRPAPARRSKVPAPPKLRDSCHTCAASKVKCNKEKPVCARCGKRGLACEYFVTKRAGRRHDRRPNDTTNVTPAVPESSSSTSSDTGVGTSANLIQPSPRQHTSDYPDILPNLLSPADSAWLSTFTALNTNFDDFSASPISFSVPDSFDPKAGAQHHIDSRGINNGLLDSNGTPDFLIPEDEFSVIDETISELPTLSKPLSPPICQILTTSDAQTFQGPRSESPCCCLILALGHLKQLFPNASTSCTRSRRQSLKNTTSQLLTLQSVVTENEQTIEEISNMLQCPCSQDGYLLAIMPLVVFKVLDWYAAAARETPVVDYSRSPSKSRPDNRRNSSCHSEQVLQFPTVVGSYCIDGEDQGRMAAQLVLSELHRVQRLVNLLSQRIKSHGMRNGTVGAPNSTTDGQDTLPDGESTSPFSATMLDQLEADLRKRLRTLSLEIVDMLRRG
ncbi:MAG: hypothetical protein ASARMPREDX12_009307 [Alectoria sarmentosa]|nr:MAG: hypothetical protein ASARMPREDX12_009307 [Alectoria sarmentosa]CAD6579802.1 MAG: hypothetical protein ASARMPRED_009259 [Alectoria sarmentosa]